MSEKQHTCEKTSVKELLFKIADELGIKKDSLLVLVSSAHEARRRLVSIDRGSGYVRGTFISSEAYRKYPERVVVNKTLDGDVVERRVGVPIDKAYHYAVVGRHGMKCTCDFAIRTASLADKLVEELARKNHVALAEQYPFSKRVLCKHTLALFDEYLRFHPSDTTLVEKNLKTALVGYALAKGELKHPVALLLSQGFFSKKKR